MILKELYQYIEERGCVSQAALAQQFGMSEDGVDAMLDVWINKGRITRIVDTDKADNVLRIRYAITRSDGIALTVTM